LQDRPHLQLHIALILWGFTAILGAMIDLSALVLVWWRVALASIVLIFWSPIRRAVMDLPNREILSYLCIGGLVGIHWLCFYGAIKVANASIALITLSLATVITAFFSRLLLNEKLKVLDLAVGFAVVPAIYLTTSGLGQVELKGFMLGIASAVLLALFGVLNKRQIDQASPWVVTFLEMLGALTVMSVFIGMAGLLGYSTPIGPQSGDILLLVILAVGCTIVPFYLHLSAMKHISAYEIHLYYNLEPVYGLILAALILGDHRKLNSSFYIGVTILIALLFAYQLIRNRKHHPTD